jgi:hypothetical protein
MGGTSSRRTHRRIDQSQGHKNGDKCPRGCGGMVTIRETQPSEKYDVDIVIYAQCSRCYWNTL